MKTDVDTCLKDIADWYVRNRREITPPELQPILLRHCESEEEAEKFLNFLETERGQMRFRTLLKEAKLAKAVKAMPKRTPEELLEIDKLGKRIAEEREQEEESSSSNLEYGFKEQAQPIIHEAITENPDPTEFMPVEVNSAFPEGSQSLLTSAEKAKVDDFIEGVPDKNDTRAINYWQDMGDKKVYLEGWIDKCLAGTGFPPMEGGEWDEKIQYMVRDTRRTLIAKQEERNRPPGVGPGYFTLIEGGFREFEAGDKEWLYGVTWGVYKPI